MGRNNQVEKGAFAPVGCEDNDHSQFEGQL